LSEVREIFLLLKNKGFSYRISVKKDQKSKNNCLEEILIDLEEISLLEGQRRIKKINC